MTLTGRDKLQMHRKFESMENASTYTSQLNEGEALKKRGKKSGRNWYKWISKFITYPPVAD